MQVNNSKGDLVALIRGTVEIGDDGLGQAVIRVYHNEFNFTSVFLYDSHLEVQ